MVGEKGLTCGLLLPCQKSLVGETGFEPATLCSQSRCATRLRYSPTLEHFKTHTFKTLVGFKSGGPGGTRTPDLAVMSGQL
jgi:hypothetical protein